MPVAATRSAPAKSDLLPLMEEAERTAEALLTEAAAAIRPRVMQGGRISGEALDREQHAAHGLAWLATYVEIVRQLSAYAKRMQDAGRFGAQSVACFTPDALRRAVDDIRAAGADELFLVPTTVDPAELDRTRDALGI